MRRCSTHLALTAAALALALPGAALAAPAAVTVRVEGAKQTFYDGPATTDGGLVTTPSGGTHRCDRTNGSGNAGKTPGPTAITALDAASRRGRFSWDGRWFDSFQDFLVDRAGTDSANDSQFWGVFVNNTASEVGGCQQAVNAGDEVLWAFDAFAKKGISRLTGPSATTTGRQVALKVTDAATGAPVSGARVGAATSDGRGVARLAFSRPGIYVLKSERADYVRSRAFRLCVDPPGAPACTSGDKAPPSVRIDVPGISSSLSRFGTVQASWQGDDGSAGSGVDRYTVDYRRVDGRGSDWKVLARNTTATSGKFGGAQGGAYYVRVHAFDRAGNMSAFAQALTLVPLDDLSPRLELSSGWRLLKRQGAYERSVSRARSRGETARLAFTGSRLALISRRLRSAGHVRVVVDDRSKVISLRGRSRFRQVVFRSRKLAAGPHRLEVTTLSRRPAEIDAVAIRP